MKLQIDAMFKLLVGASFLVTSLDAFSSFRRIPTSARRKPIRLEWINAEVAFSKVRSCTRVKSVSNDVEVDVTPSSKPVWFPTRATDSAVLDYHSTVKSLFLRQVLVETEEMADTALAVLKSSMTHSADPFGDLARSLSSCKYSREEGGKVGWCDNPRYLNPTTSPAANNSGEIELMIPRLAIETIFDEKKPKAGDILRLRSERGVSFVASKFFVTNLCKNNVQCTLIQIFLFS